MSDSHTPNDGSASLPSDEGGRRKASRPKSFVGRHKALVALAVIALLLLGSVGGYAYWLNSQLGNIARVDAGITESDGQPDDDARPLNVLLLGADHGGDGTTSVAEDLADGKWTPGQHLSDTIIIMHIPADRDSVQLVSIPRDTWTKIDGYPYGNGHAKINAAFSYGGPSMARQTVEDVTGLHIDHMAIIDWEGFRDLTTALGGVRVYVPKTVKDDSQHVTWQKGWQTLEGEKALQYVRTRHGLSNGDFDRIERQQNFLRATMSKLLSAGTTRNPIRMTKVVGVITEQLTVDNTWDNDEIRNLALSLRSLGTDDVDFLTAPFGRYDTSSDGQSIVRLDKKQTTHLFAALAHDRVDDYLAQHPDEKLPDDKSVN